LNPRIASFVSDSLEKDLLEHQRMYTSLQTAFPLYMAQLNREHETLLQADGTLASLQTIISSSAATNNTDG
jgi:hypothetical protein